MPAPDRGFTDPPAGASDERWRVALTKQDLRWMTTEEIAEAYRAGAVQLETFVFRVGMPTWVTLLEIPEIARALGQDAEAHALNGQSRASSMPPPRRAPRRAPGEARAGDETDAGDPLPFALERASTAKKDVAPTTTDDDDAERLSVGAELEPVAAAAAEQPAPADVPTPLVPPAAPTPDALPPAQPFASNVLAQRSSDSKVWMWVLIVLAIAIAAALVIGPRFGFRLF